MINALPNKTVKRTPTRGEYIACQPEGRQQCPRPVRPTAGTLGPLTVGVRPLGGPQVLIELRGCIFDRKQLALSHGFEHLEPVDQEAFVNHVHFQGAKALDDSGALLSDWEDSLAATFPGRQFRMYRSVSETEITVRFHLVRPGVSNWCEHGCEIFDVLT